MGQTECFIRRLHEKVLVNAELDNNKNFLEVLWSCLYAEEMNNLEDVGIDSRDRVKVDLK